ncbi:hypothetical protein COO60DRAFT_1643814 [Scenedesmus sp. NREL 46B-D3]|nr:hypothetical protein COO60DRAFT_1643814 [Scenedesmus sp. NREL 46B-D3]
MPLSTATYNTRLYDGPAITSNATAVTVTGDMHVTKGITTPGNVTGYDLHATNMITADQLKVSTLDVTGDMDVPNVRVAHSASTNISFANVTAHGHDIDSTADIANQVFITNAIKRAFYGSIWLGGGSSAQVVHNLDVDANQYCVTATFCETGSTQQVVTLQVSEKQPNSFWINCVPDNTSETASVNFAVHELATSLPAAPAPAPEP